MFRINCCTKDIILTRANSATIDTTPYIDGTQSPLILQDGDRVILTVKTRPNGKTLIQKVATNADYDEDNNLIIKLSPADTDLTPFTYVYDICYISSAGDVYTYIDASKFIIAPVIGYYKEIAEGVSIESAVT